MADGTIVWVPRSAGELTDRRQRVRTTTDPTVETETYVLGLATIALPVIIVISVPTPIVGRVLVALALGLLCLVAFLITRRGLYLSTRGVTVWRAVVPHRIPWDDVARFRLGPDEVHAGSTESERVTVVHVDGETTDCWFLSRRTAFEAEPLPPGSAATMRSFPALVDQLNRIRAELD